MQAQIRSVEAGKSEPTEDHLQSLGRQVLRRQLSRKVLHTGFRAVLVQLLIANGVQDSKLSVIARPDLLQSAKKAKHPQEEDDHGMAYLMDNGSVFGFAVV